MISVVADNSLGKAACGELRRYGVDVTKVVETAGRMGLYFLSQGAVRRPSEIVYDRKGSAFDLSQPNSIDWEQSLDGVEWLHISGVTPAIGELCADSTRMAVNAASKAGVKVSFDGNYRPMLWQAWDGDGAGVLGEILAHATCAFINERDIGLILRREFSGKDIVERRKVAFETAFEHFPKLEVIAATTRQQVSVGHHFLGESFVHGKVIGDLIVRNYPE